MAVTHLLGFEMGASGEAFFQAGTPSFQSTVKRSGTYSMRSTTLGYAQLRSRAAGGTFRNWYKSMQFYMRIDTMVGSATTIVQLGSSVAVLQLNTNGTLSLLSGVTVRATSTNALTADAAFHRIDFDCGHAAGSGMRVYVDGVLWATDSTDVIAAQSFIYVGCVTTPTGGCDIYFDDIVTHDSALPATLVDYSLGMLLPVSDSAVGGWLSQDGLIGTTLYDAVNNVPPVGSTATTVSPARLRAENVVSSATDNFDVVCATYDSLIAGGTVLAVQAITNTAQEVTTGSPKAGAVVITANPSGQTESSFDFGLPNGVAGSTTAAAMGTWPTGWGSNPGPVTETPTITSSAGPTVRVGKRTATTREVDVTFLGVYVMWAAAAASAPVRYRLARQAVHRSLSY